MANTRSTESPTSEHRLSSTGLRKRRKSAAESAAQAAAAAHAAEEQASKERSKKGCWTCRIRRKKCDVRPIDGRCETCIRLKLECLGWGAKRPDWMRDADAVTRKKAEIKQQLGTQGMIRGQAKPPPDIVVNPPIKGSINSSEPLTNNIMPVMIGLNIEASTQGKHSPLLNHNSLYPPSHFSPENTLSSAATTPAILSVEPEDGLETMHIQGFPSLFSNATPTPDETFTKSPLDPPNGFATEASFNLDNHPLGIHGFGPSAYSTNDFFMTSFQSTGSSSLNPLGTTMSEEATSEPLTSSSSDPSSSSSSTMDHAGSNRRSNNLSSITDNPAIMSISEPALLQQQQLLGGLTQPHALATSNSASMNLSMDITAGLTFDSLGVAQFANFLMEEGYTGSYVTPASTVGNATGSASDATDSASGPAAMLSGFLSLAYQQQAPHYPHHPPLHPLGLGNPPESVAGTSSSTQAKEDSVMSTTTLTTKGLQNPLAHLPAPMIGAYTVPRIRSPLSNASPFLTTFQETLVFYYFNRGVRRMQYLLADDGQSSVSTGPSLTDVFYDLIIRDPKGPVTNAICSLASLHDTRLQIANGLIHPEDLNAHDNAQRFYADAVRQLAMKNGAFTEVEAIASLHLLSFWLFCGGGGDWTSALVMAGNWYANSEVMRAGADPVKVLRELSPSAKFAAQGTMWMDILGSVSLRQTPRFLDLYRRLRKGSHSPTNPQRAGGYFGGASFAGSSVVSNCSSGAGLNTVMGCDDDVMFAIAEIAALAAWKEEQKDRRSLSIRELCRRGDAIEEILNTCCLGPRARNRGSSPHATSPTSASSTHGRNPPSVWNPFHVASIPNAAISEVLDLDISTATSRLSGSQSPPTKTPPALAVNTLSSKGNSSNASGAYPQSHLHHHHTHNRNGQPITLRQLSSNVFREAAFLYLHTVLSGPEPNVPEIKASVSALVAAIVAIPSTDLDRSLAFPITIGGCMADSADDREFFRGRLDAQGTALGNGSQVKLLMETVWKRRDAGESAVCWRETMNELRFDLLLV